MKPYVHLSEAQLKAEIEKCIHCAEKPCKDACPADCSPADFIMAARLQNSSDYLRSAEEILSKNPLGHVCGVVCPDTFCMDACSRKHFDCAVDIPRIQAAILERARKLRPAAPPKPALNGKRVAVVGAGPAGLAATAFLARKGYTIDLYDSGKTPGGACLQIPETRLPRSALAGDIAAILASGEIKTFFGKPAPATAVLLKKADAVLIAIGEPDVTPLGVPGENLAVSSIEYLKNPSKYRKARSIAIVGGGAVAADCATTARKQGAASVEMFVRRTLAEMPLTAFERNMLLDERIDITTRTRILEVRKSGGKLTLTVTKVAPAGEKNGRPVLKDIAGTRTKRPGFDLVIKAIGTSWAERASADLKTPGVFYAGDCVEGASTVVQAAASGKNAAAVLDLALSKASTTELKKARAPGSRSTIKSRLSIDGILRNPVDLKAEFFGIPISSPFLLSAAPATDGIDQMRRAYAAGWAGGVMKTAFDNLPIHIPGQYMVTFGDGARTHGNADNVSGHPLDRVCREIEILRKEFPDRLTLGSTGGPVTGHDAEDARVWQANTRKLERAGALGVEYSLSCPQGGDGTEGAIVSQSAAATAKVIDWVMQVSDPSIPKLFKLTSAVTSLAPILKAVREVLDRYPGKKAGITLANSFPVMAFRKDPAGSPRKWDQGMVVGMSGEGVVPISYLALAEASRFGVTVSGNGGVMDYRAAANFLALGARTVQVCTVATRYGIEIIGDLNSGLSHFLQEKGLKSVHELIGIALPNPITGFGDLSATKQISSVSPALCQSCGNCTWCPYMAISLNKRGLPVIDASRCIGCSICVKQCFAGALKMRDRTPHETALLQE